MHKSKLCGFIIDCQSSDLDAAADFWGHALGMPVHSRRRPRATVTSAWKTSDQPLVGHGGAYRAAILRGARRLAEFRPFGERMGMTGGSRCVLCHKLATGLFKESISTYVS